MNVFIVDADPKQAAIALADRHVVKMPLEAGQMLSTVLRGRGLSTVCLLYTSPSPRDA